MLTFFLFYRFFLNLIFIYPKIIVYCAIASNCNALVRSYYLSHFDIFIFLTFINKSSFFRLKSLVELTSVDNLIPYFRFSVFYFFLSVPLNFRIKLHFKVSEFDSIISSCCIYGSANWLERELYDMFGIKILEHPNLRRLLSDYGFLGFPLRKDFPCEGFFECYYSLLLSRVCYINVNLS